MDSNTSRDNLQHLHGKESVDERKIAGKKGRGPSKLILVSGQQKPKMLERNEFGQPIGDNSMKYTFFLGCMVKEFVSYTLDRWNDVDEDVKSKMWGCLHLHFNVEEWEKKTIFQKLGELWRDRKSKLQILIREVNTGRSASRDLSLLKPEFMDQNQWVVFVKKTLSSAFQEKSAKFREMRVKQDHNHTMSRRGYARLAYMMGEKSPADTPITRSKVWIEAHKKKMGSLRKIEECPPESLNTTNIADDAISLVFGKVARDRVRGMGFGVTQSKAGACIQQNGTIKQLQNMLNNFQQEMQEMRSMFLRSMRQRNDQEQVASGGISSGIGYDICSSSGIIGAKNIGNVDNVMQHAAKAQSNLKNVNSEGIHDNTKCKLLHWCDDEVVAEGRVVSTDPKAKVHHMLFGGSCWKIWVDKVLVEKVDLIRSNDEMLYLDDAIGSIVAWLSKLIVLCD